MSALAILITAVIAAGATLIWALVTDTWTPRALVGMWLFGMLLLLLPGLIK